MKITKEFIKENENKTMREVFPEVFENFKTGWFKHKNGLHQKWFWYVDFKTLENYGVNSVGSWQTNSDKMYLYIKKYCEPMSESEVFEALKNEAARRGFVEGAYFKSTNDEYGDKIIEAYKTITFGHVISDNKLLFCNRSIFENGIWATIIETITKDEAEKQLGKKIV
jgi:hypothetical protein